jgi:hypothetical protein
MSLNNGSKWNDEGLVIHITAQMQNGTAPFCSFILFIFAKYFGVHACVRACVRACVHACVRACVAVG